MVGGVKGSRVCSGHVVTCRPASQSKCPGRAGANDAQASAATTTFINRQPPGPGTDPAVATNKVVPVGVTRDAGWWMGGTGKAPLPPLLLVPPP